MMTRRESGYYINSVHVIRYDWLKQDCKFERERESESIYIIINATPVIYN